jgi:hypothetical protein
METDFNQEKVIKGLTSLALVQIGDPETFWSEAFDLINERIKPERLDAFLIMNLLWTMARNVSSLSQESLDSLIAKVTPHLH